MVAARTHLPEGVRTVTPMLTARQVEGHGGF